MFVLNKVAFLAIPLTRTNSIEISLAEALFNAACTSWLRNVKEIEFKLMFKVDGFKFFSLLYTMKTLNISFWYMKDFHILYNSKKPKLCSIRITDIDDEGSIQLFQGVFAEHPTYASL